MSKAKRAITAQELLGELRKDSKWVAQQQKDEEERKRLFEEFVAAEQPVLKDLIKLGIDVPTLGDANYVAPYLPLSAGAVAVLLRWVPHVSWRVKDAIVRLLACPSTPYNGTMLTELFDATLKIDLDKEELRTGIYISDLRWSIANTIAEARPIGISEWVAEKVRDPSLGKSKEMLLVALARLLPSQVAIPLLKEAFTEYPVHTALALSEIGEESEVSFLRENLASVDRSVRESIVSSIRHIEKRKTSHRSSQ